MPVVDAVVADDCSNENASRPEMAAGAVLTFCGDSTFNVPVTSPIKLRWIDGGGIVAIWKLTPVVGIPRRWPCRSLLKGSISSQQVRIKLMKD